MVRVTEVSFTELYDLQFRLLWGAQRDKIPREQN